jgi:DNA recombination protein Rad52
MNRTGTGTGTGTRGGTADDVVSSSSPSLDRTCLAGGTGASYSESTRRIAARMPSPPPRSSTGAASPPATVRKDVRWVHNPGDGSVLLDHHGEPVSVDRLLATKPLRHELSTRPGPGGKKLTYISGEGVSRTLNDIFGFDGWNLDITAVNQAECSQDDKGRYTVVYTAQVRLTHKASGTYKEDVGAGDATDKSKGTAISHAQKASVTDAMKRAARHFGDKLGNCEHRNMDGWCSSWLLLFCLLPWGHARRLLVLRFLLSSCLI